MGDEQKLLHKLSNLETGTAPLLISISEAIADGRLGIDDTSRRHLESINHTLARLLEEAAQGRVDMLGGLRDEIRLLSKTVAIVAQQARISDTDPNAIELPFKAVSDPADQANDQPPLQNWLARNQTGSKPKT
jgi:hypothetical protein